MSSVAAAVEAERARMVIKREGDTFAGAPTDRIIAHLDAREHLRRAPGKAVGAGHPEKAATGVDAERLAAAVMSVQKEKPFARNVPGLRVGKVGNGHALELVNGVRFRAAMDVRRPAGTVGG